jgi:hypothetical protein
VGLLTVDVTALGIVMTSDSRPIEIGSGDIRVPPFVGEQRRNKILERHGGGFDGLIGYVGTEQIGGRSTRAFIEQVSTACPDLGLGEFVRQLAYELSRSWIECKLSTGLWVFIAGAESGELRFWFLRNLDFDGGLYVNLRSAFTAVDDLDEHAVPRVMRENNLTSKDEVLSRIALFFRNGALIPAASILDDFDALIRRLYAGGYAGFDPISSLDEYARLVRMRQEFVKRMFDSSKGIYRAGRSPIGGVIYIRSVSPQGAIFEHGKNVKS